MHPIPGLCHTIARFAVFCHLHVSQGSWGYGKADWVVEALDGGANLVVLYELLQKLGEDKVGVPHSNYQQVVHAPFSCGRIAVRARLGSQSCHREQCITDPSCQSSAFTQVWESAINFPPMHSLALIDACTLFWKGCNDQSPPLTCSRT